MANVEIESSSFQCYKSQCDYSFQLKNNSNTEQSGTVYILLRYLPTRSSSGSDMGNIEKTFVIAPQSSAVFTGNIKSSKKLDAYFQINNK